MSWNFEFFARSKGEAKSAVAARMTGYGLTQSAGDALIALIDALPSNENTVVAVKTNGHIDANYGGALFDVRLVALEQVLTTRTTDPIPVDKGPDGSGSASGNAQSGDPTPPAPDADD